MKTLDHYCTFTHETYALILAKENTFTTKDQQNLFDIGLKNVLCMNEGIKVAEMLAEKCIHKQKLPEVILCYEHLNDITSTSFSKLLQLHPSLITIPIVPVLSNTENIPKNIKSILGPHYTSNDLLEALTITQKKCLDTRPTTQDTTIFTTTITQLKKNISSKKTCKIQDVYIAALQAIKKRNIKEGIALLQYILNIDPKHTNALLALAVAYKEDGDKNKYIKILHILLSIYVKKKEWKHAKVINKRLVTALNGQSNPLYDQAYTFLSLGYISNAAHAIIAGRLTSDQNNIMYKTLVNGCLKTQYPDETIQKLKTCLLEISDEFLTKEIIDYLENAVSKNIEKKTQIRLKPSVEDKQHEFILSSKEKRKKKKQNKRSKDQETILMQQLEPIKMLSFSPKLQQAVSIFRYTYYLLRSSKNNKNS